MKPVTVSTNEPGVFELTVTVHWPSAFVPGAVWHVSAVTLLLLLKVTASCAPGSGAPVSTRLAVSVKVCDRPAGLTAKPVTSTSRAVVVFVTVHVMTSWLGLVNAVGTSTSFTVETVVPAPLTHCHEGR